MTRIKKIFARSVSERMSARLLIVIAITAMVSRDLLTISSVTAFSTVPLHSHSSAKVLRKHNAGVNQYKYFQRSASPLSAKNEKFPAIDENSKLTSAAVESTKIERKHKTVYLNAQRALAGFLLTLTIATTTIGGFPSPANAGFGPSSGAATTQPPNLKSITGAAKKNQKPSESASVNDFNIDLDGKKLRILIDSALNPSRLNEFSDQLEEFINNLGDSVTSLASGDDNENETREQARLRKEEQLEKARTLKLQIQKQEKMLKKLENEPYWFNYFAAFVGSTVSTLIMHPLDTIKTRLQVKKEGEEEEEGMSGEKDVPWQSGGVAVVGVSSSSTSSGLGAIGNIGDLYEGLTGNLFKEVPPSAVYLGVYETVKYALAPKVAPVYLLWVYLVAGAAGETVGSIIRAPAEAVKSLVQSGARGNALEAVQSVLGTPEGRLNVLRAWSASIGRDVPFGAIQLAIFEMIKATILNNPEIEIDSSTLLSEALIGAFAGGFASLVTNPADVITTRIITQDTEADGESEDAPLGVLEMGQKIYQEEGFGAFFKGWPQRVGYWAPAIGIFLSCYCSVRQAGVTYDLFP